MMRKLIPVDGHPDFARDEKTGMIVNINKSKHKQQMEMIERIKQDKEEINSLKSEVNDIKKLLSKLLENDTNG